MGPIQTLDELFGMLRRRFPLIAAVFGIAMAGALYFAYIQPYNYEASAVLQVESPSVTGDAPTGGVTTAQRLQLIQQRLMARDNVLEMIETHGLFPALRQLPDADRVQALTNVIRIDSISAIQQGYGNDGRVALKALLGDRLALFVGLDDPQKAADVANDLAARVVDQDLRSRVAQAEESLNFFAAEEKRIGEQMTKLESEMAAFKNDNDDALPDGLSFRRDELSRLWENSLDLDQKILDLERELAALESDNAIRIGEGTPGANPVEEELRQLEVELAQARRVFAPGHPEIQRLETRIEAVTSGSGEARLAAATRQRLMVSSQIGALQAQKNLLDERRVTIETAINRMPEVERRLNSYERRLRQLQDEHSVVNRRRTEAETTLKLQAGQQTERFEVLEPALPPATPSSSKRKKIVVFGFAASAGLAMGIAFLLEILNPVMRSASQMQRMLGLQPVVSIPEITPHKEGPRKRRSVAFFAVMAAALLLGSFVALGLPFS